MQMTHLDTQFVATLPAALLPFISLCAILLGMAMKFLNKLKKVLGSDKTGDKPLSSLRIEMMLSERGWIIEPRMHLVWCRFCTTCI
jgi:hypothetical protein